ncbi:MAG: type II and III secretion system protein [Crocinitomicaceae bacterium]|nr:type II and III secretion system protein [Crocinitomicaceae bacterium]
MKSSITALMLFLLAVNVSFGQKYSEETLRTKLDSVAIDHPGLNNELQLNVSGLQLSELVNSVALENNLNISIEPSLDQRISYNFYDAQVKDMLVFLYLNFSLEYDFIGSIISIQKRDDQDPVVIAPKQIDITYNEANKFLSMNLKNDTLWRVIEQLTKVTGQNFVIDPEVRNKIVNAYFLNRPSEQVLEMFARSNELDVVPQDDYFAIRKSTIPVVNPPEDDRKKRDGQNYQSTAQNGDFVLIKNDVGTLDVFANSVDLSDVVKAAAQESGVHYVLYSDIVGKVNLDVSDLRFDELMDIVLEGTAYSIREEDGLYMIGEHKLDGLRITELIRLENRTIESVKKAIPKDYLTELEVFEFEELNGLIVTGGSRKINQLKQFIYSIDVVVPMVQIDVMLLFTKKSHDLKTGIEAGIADAPVTTGGTIFPGLDVTMGANSINNILNAITGFGVVNLGQVSQNFYLSLSALEDNGDINIESTPKISTLNGHEATISIGAKTHYQQTQVNVQTSANNQGYLQSEEWTAIDANLSVRIKPFVSADEYVTLTISVEQNDFAGKMGPTAPPDMTTRSFESMIRVKNGEMILLGGLEEKKKNDTGRGVPLLSRIPILKWLFSSRKKEREKSKLHILIRPTVTY